ncbi:MAG: hypothetical protein RL591_610 [Planctomycetota bacterium]
MAARETPAARIERFLMSGDAAGAIGAANELLAQSPRSFIGLLGRARAHLRLRDNISAENDLNAALSISPNDELALLLRANMDFHLGRTDPALAALRKIAAGRSTHAHEAAINLLESLHGAGRHDEHAEFVRKGGAWTKDERAQLHIARTRFREDAEAGIEALKGVFRSRAHLIVRRYAGFEAVGHLDRMKRYREAFDFASEVHRATTGPIDLAPWLGLADEQLRLLAKQPMPFVPRAEHAPNLAFIVAMPRSGTTLLEQMLDRHDAIGGIGEFDGLDHICRAMTSHPMWFRVPSAVPQALVDDLRRRYIEGAAQIRRAGATWTLDKSLRSWRALPEIATIFPGAVAVSVDRDPRDVATSIFLSYFNPSTYEWTSSFDAIRQVIEAQRRVVPAALDALQLPSERIVYEDLVEDPAADAARVLARMGLAMDERVLSPELNPKGADTLSRAQVRQPINRKSIGRWKNYEWAFDAKWDAVVAAHEARRQRRPA